MKAMLGGQEYRIETKRKYSIDEIFEIMTTANFEEKFGGPIELKKGFLEKNVTVPGLGKWKNVIQTTKQTIMVSQIKEQGLLGDIVDHVTEGALANIKTVGTIAGLGGAKDNKEILKKLAEEIEKLVEVKTGGCYVATCVYGSYDCPEVLTLRRYRDTKLSHTLFGKLFIWAYYIVSPRIVAIFGSNKLFNKLCKSILNRFVQKLQRNGVGRNACSD